MADEAYLLSLAVGARDDLSALRDELDGFQGWREQLFSLLDQPEAFSVPLPDDGFSDGVGRTVGVIEGAPDGFYADLMAAQWCQCVIGVLVVVALMLSLGVQLWTAFSDQWRL